MPAAKKDDKGRIGRGRFNRDLTYPKDGDKKSKGPEKRINDNKKGKDNKKDASKQGFKPKAKPQK